MARAGRVKRGPIAGRRPGRRGSIRRVRQLMQFFRENPQVLVLAIVCLVLGIGTFLAVVFGLISAGTTKVTGQPSGAIALGFLGW